VRNSDAGNEDDCEERNATSEPHDGALSLSAGGKPL
jgi:hypothetical protein